MLIEGICNIKEIPGKLHQQIDRLLEDREINKNQAQILHELRRHGNETAHQLYSPNRSELKGYIDVLENILENLFNHPVLSHQLENKRVKRQH